MTRTHVRTSSITGGVWRRWARAAPNNGWHFWLPGLNDVGDGEGPPVPGGLHNNVDFRN